MTTIVEAVFATVGAVTILAALGLYGLARREAAICRHVDAHTPHPYDWAAEPLDGRDVDLWCKQVMAADTAQIMNEATP